MDLYQHTQSINFDTNVGSFWSRHYKLTQLVGLTKPIKQSKSIRLIKPDFSLVDSKLCFTGGKIQSNAVLLLFPPVKPLPYRGSFAYRLM